MGLFSMFTIKHDNYLPAHAKKESPTPARKTTVVEQREYVRDCSIIGDEEYTVYTYDATPLKGVKTGQNIWLELTNQPIEIYTQGMDEPIYNSLSFGTTTLLYKGQPIGAASRTDRLNGLLERGWRVKIKAKKVGWYDRESGIPELKICIPDLTSINAWADACEIFGVDELYNDAIGNIVSFSINECDVTMPERTFKPGDENLTITIKKDPEHPRQKEHVFIDFLGKPFINIPATYGCYYPIVNQAYRPIKHAGFRRELTNTGYQYNVVFWFEPIDLN